VAELLNGPLHALSGACRVSSHCTAIITVFEIIAPS
jgi:hypothetical protein